ncbi:MAG TPA: hypothetical protein VEB67_02375, partial [Nitrososphaerales archaeon]|nr:hypothetical protein [Nitrososphaerales archaeon]
MVGSQISWGLYLFAAVGLLLAVTPTLQSASSASADAAALGVLGGLKSAFDNLRPGETAVLDLSASGVAGRVVL